MADFKKVASKADIPEGSGKAVELDGKKVAVFNVGGDFHAINNTCAHRGGSLGEGSLEDATVTCPLHGWQYDVKTGECSTTPGAKMEVYEVKVEGDDILVSTG